MTAGKELNCFKFYYAGGTTCIRRVLGWKFEYYWDAAFLMKAKLAPVCMKSETMLADTAATVITQGLNLILI